MKRILFLLCFWMLAVGVKAQSSKGITRIQCYACEEIDKNTCSICDGARERAYMKGLGITLPGSSKEHPVPVYFVKRIGNNVQVIDLITNVEFNLIPSKTANPNGGFFSSAAELVSFINGCSCTSGGGGGSDNFLTSAILVGTTLNFNMADASSFSVDLSTIAGGGGGDVITGVTYDGTTFNITTDMGAFNVNINAGTLNTTTAITVDGTAYPIGTDIQSIIEDIANSAVYDFTVNAGPTAVPTDAALGSDVISDGGIIHFTSDGSVDFNVGAGAVVTASVNISADLGNNIALGTDNGIFSPTEITVAVGAPVAAPGVGDPSIYQNSSTGGLYTHDGATWTAIGGGGEATTVTDGNTVDFTLTGTDITAEITGSQAAANGSVPVSDGAGNVSWQVLAGGLLVYDADPTAGTAMVKATALGITFSKAAGVGTFVIPSGVELVSARIAGANTDLGVGNDFQVVLDYTGIGYNSGLPDLFPPSIVVLNATAQALGGPTPTFPFVQDEGGDPQIQLTGLTGGDVTSRVINLNVFPNWYIMISL